MTRAPLSSLPDIRRAMARRREERRAAGGAVSGAGCRHCRARARRGAARPLPRGGDGALPLQPVSRSGTGWWGVAGAAGGGRRLLSVNVPTNDPRHVAAIDAILGGGARVRRMGSGDALDGGTPGGRAAGDRGASQDAARSCVAHAAGTARGRRAADRLDAGDADAARPHRARGRHRLHHAHRGRVGDRQGTGRQADPRVEPAPAGPFVAINCAALVESLLEAELFGIEERTATGVRGRRASSSMRMSGTLFLDEVSDLSHGRAGQALCGRFRTWPSSASAGMARTTLTSGSSRRPIEPAIAGRRWRFRADLSIGSAASNWMCRRCASATPISWSCRDTSSNGTARRGGSICHPR